MKKKKGFTLIELLAVIVILAIIMVIAVPKILDLIEESRQSAVLESGQLYVDAVNKYMSFNEMDSVKYPFVKSNDNNYTVDDLREYVKMKGSYPTSGDLTIIKKVTYADLCINGYNVLYENSNYSLTTSDKCGKAVANNDEAESETVIDDKDSCVLEQDSENANIYYIDSVEDMYAFSDSVNSGNLYEGKTIKLRNSLDFSNYTSDNKPTVCSTNDNENGFTPIGTESSPFKGIFEGNGKTIKNLNISLPNTDLVGLFSYAYTATIRGLNMQNISIEGKTYVGAVGGSLNSSNVSEITLKNVNIKGSQNVAGVSGYGPSPKNIYEENVNIISTSSGYMISPTTPKDSVIYKGSLTSTNNSNEANNNNVYWSNEYLHNGTAVSGGVDKSRIKDINYLESAYMDTMINGDNDSSGYYFDYDNGGEIIVKSTSESPIDTSLSGSGTAADPYIIDSYDAWKKAAAITKTSAYVYKLTNDIDFSGKKFYMLSNANVTFKGTFEGGGKTLKNITLNGANLIGIFGNSTSAIIRGFNLENVDVHGNTYVSAVVGSPQAQGGSVSQIYEISMKNVNVEGTNYVTLVSGFSNGNVNNILVKDATVIGTGSAVKLISISTPTNSIIEKAQLTSGDSYSNEENASKVYWSTDYKINGNTASSGFDTSYINDLDYYTGKVEVGSDTNNSGYYFDKVNGTIKVVSAN